MVDNDTDYSGAGATEQEQAAPETDEQVLAYLNENDDGSTQTGAPTLEELEEAANKDGATDEDKVAALEARAAQDGKDTAAGNTDKTPEQIEADKVAAAAKAGDEEEFDSTLAFLNKTHELGLNLADLPTDMTREQEAEAISGIIGRMVNGVNSQVQQYEDVRTLLKDPEVANFIQAKAEGKTMADFAKEYAGTPNGMSDELLASQELKIKLPHLSDEDVAAQIQSMKDRDKLGEFTTKIRQEREATATETEENNKKAVALQQQQQEETRIGEVNDFNQFMQDKNDIYGIPLNTDMKKQIFGAATQIDNNGETYLEKALQSNEGVLLATAGLLHMERLMKGYASLDVNQRKKSFMDTLFDSPDALQSASSEHKQEGFDIDAANQF